jgi:hypothetical protein
MKSESDLCFEFRIFFFSVSSVPLWLVSSFHPGLAHRTVWLY